MSNSKFHYKGISTLIGIIIVLFVLLAGGILAWQYFWRAERVEKPVRPEEVMPEEKIEPEKISEEKIEPEKIIESETANWEIYRDMDYGYEIKYPPGASVGAGGWGLIRIKNLPREEENIEEKDLKIDILHNYSEKSCYLVGPKAATPTYTIINNRKVLISRDLIQQSSHSRTVEARLYIPQRNQCLNFDLYFHYFETPKQPPPVNNEGETKILYQIISTLSLFEPQPRYIKILFPNGGEELMTGSKCAISWETRGVEKIDIILAERKGERRYDTEREIVNDFVLRGENKYEWNIPSDLPPSKYVIFIQSDDEGRQVEDFSDNYFTISGPLSIQEKEKMLREMFKGEFTIEGNKIVSSALEPPLTLYLDKIIQGSFLTPYAKEYLFIVQHYGGKFTQSFLGVFDKTKHFAFPPVDINSVQDFKSPISFFGVELNFSFYSCKGITYILEITGSCPMGGVCEDDSFLFKVENGKFKRVQNVFETFLDIIGYEQWPKLFRIKTKENKLLFYEWKLVDYNFNCIAPNCIGEDEFGAYLRDNNKVMRLFYSGELVWDNNECRFVQQPE